MESYSAAKLLAAAPALSILIAVGFLLGAWMFSGTLPMFIYYGVQLVNAKWILASGFLLCAIFSISTGTSWGSVATAGITMMGIATAMPDVNIAAVAGACYTGAIFGDKLSPLSDTTILAALSTNNDIFDHIKHMSMTVVPAGLIGLLIYIIMGVGTKSSTDGLPENTLQMLNSIEEIFNFNVIVLLPLVIVLFGAISKKPSTLVMMVSAFVALLIGIFYQGFAIFDGVTTMYSGFNMEMAESAREGFVAADAGFDAGRLMNRGGLGSMMKAFIVVYIAFYYAGIMDLIGALDVLLDKMMNSVKTRFGLVLATSVASVLLVAVSGGSTLALILNGQIFSDKYREMGYSTLNLSRTMEDFSTGMAGLIPWTASGVYYPAILGVGIASYFPYAFMIYIVWVFAYFYGVTGIAFKPLEEDKKLEIKEEEDVAEVI